MSNFKPWINAAVTDGTSKNCLDALDFGADSQRVVGFKGGTPASALRVNSGLRQANLVVAGLMDSILDENSDLSLASSIDDVKSAISTKLVKDIIASETQIGLKYYDERTFMITVPFATSAETLTNNPSITANGNNIRITAGGKTSSDFTVPFATKSLRLSAGKGSNNTPVYFDDNGDPQTVTGLAKNLTVLNGVISYTSDGISKTLDTTNYLYEHNISLFKTITNGSIHMYISILTADASRINYSSDLANLLSTTDDKTCSGYFYNGSSVYPVVSVRSDSTFSLIVKHVNNAGTTTGEYVDSADQMEDYVRAIKI